MRLPIGSTLVIAKPWSVQYVAALITVPVVIVMKRRHLVMIRLY